MDVDITENLECWIKYKYCAVTPFLPKWMKNNINNQKKKYRQHGTEVSGGAAMLEKNRTE